MPTATRSAPDVEKSPSNGMPEYQFHGGDIRILVIDDDPAIGRLIQTVLVNPQITIDSVSESDKVRGSLEAHQYHVILMDYVIPDLEATTILGWIKELQSDASVIVVTAFPSMDSALTCLRSHTFDYVPKPFRLDDMKKTLMRCLESRGLLRLSEEALREQIGASIRERRKALGLTLSDLAKRTGVSLGYLSQIELGKNSASIETLYRIALGLRIRVADLFQAVQSPL
ncbi:MAG TPA: response regulator [Gemmataceae bacterium]|nr:response regulator [Gemmataceae bacterium]